MAPSPAAGRGRGSDVPRLGGEGKTLFGRPLRKKRGRAGAKAFPVASKASPILNWSDRPPGFQFGERKLDMQRGEWDSYFLGFCLLRRIKPS